MTTRRSFFGLLAGLFCLPWWKPKPPVTEITAENIEKLFSRLVKEPIHKQRTYTYKVVWCETRIINGFDDESLNG